MIALEFFTSILAKRERDMEYGFFNPYADYTYIRDPKTRPTHYTTEGGGTYSLRPDLARMGGPNTYVVLGFGAAMLGIALTTEAIVGSFGKLIREEAENVQAAMWRGFAQGLTGGFGIGTLDLTD